MLGPAIGSVREDAAMREVGKTAAKNDGGGQIHRVQGENRRTPDAINRRMVFQPGSPGEIARVIKIQSSEQGPKRLVAEQRSTPSHHSRFSPAQVRVEQ